MPFESNTQRIAWYKTPLSRETLAALNERSDLKGFAQTLGHLGLLVASGAAAWYAAGHLPWPIFLVLLYAHGTFSGFLGAAFHELTHQTVFKTKPLNFVFLYVVSWLSWANPFWYCASPQVHHKFSLHPPDDLEVVLPYDLTLKYFLRSLVVNPWDFYYRFKMTLRLSLGRTSGQWEASLFPLSARALRRRVFGWSRFILISHLLVAAVGLYFGLWQVVVLLTLAPFYGGCLLYLCGNTQHSGLQNNVPDF